MSNWPPPLKKILVVKLSAIGDVILAGYSFRAIKEQWPQAQLTVLTSHRTAPLLLNNRYVDHVLEIDEMIFWKKQIGPLMRLFKRLRDERYDAVFIMHWSTAFHWFFGLMGIPNRIGFEREGKSWRLTRKKPYVEGKQVLHDVQQYGSLVTDSKMDLSRLQDYSPLQYSQEEIKEFDRRMKAWAAQDSKPWIAVAPGGGNNPKLFMPQKRWPASSFAGVIQELQNKKNASIFLLGDASEKELLAPFLPASSNFVNLCGELSLRETGLLLRHCRLFIGNDSGLLHVAGAVGTPSLSFFGPTAPDGKVPVWAAHRVLYRQEACSPCYKYGKAPPCPYELKCLTQITVDDAFSKASELLAASGVPA